MPPHFSGCPTQMIPQVIWQFTDLKFYFSEQRALAPFILNATLLKQLSLHPSKVFAMLQRDLYVDYVLTSVDSEDSAVKYFQESREYLQQGGFNLRVWMSNSDKLRDFAKSENVLDADKETKILGMRWNTDSDAHSFAET